MEIKDIDKLASLARIEMSDEEKKEILADMDEILGYVGEIQKVSADEPNEEDRMGILHNVMREDGEPTTPGKNTKTILDRAPKTKDGYFKVKKIL